MKSLQCAPVLLCGILIAGDGLAASPYAGQEKAAAVCSQCHGMKHPSADGPYPTLAGRDSGYLKTALKQYRDKTRVSDIMNAIAGSLTDQDIADVVSYYNHVQD